MNGQLAAATSGSARLSKTGSTSANAMYLTMSVQCTSGHCSWSDQIEPLMKKLCAKNDFYIFVSGDLDLLPLDLKFSETPQDILFNVAYGPTLL